jgi:hypothetical protein
MLPLVRRPDSHVFEPPDLWQTRIDAAFRDRAQRIQGSTPARAVHRGPAPPALARRAGGPGRAQAHLGGNPTRRFDQRQAEQRVLALCTRPMVRARGQTPLAIHPSSVAVSQEHPRAKTDPLDTELLKRGFLRSARPRVCHRARHSRLIRFSTRTPPRVTPSTSTPSLLNASRWKRELALDGVGDTSPMHMMSCLSESGILVSYGGTSRKPMVVNPGSFIFKKQTIRGFWLLYWYQSAKPDEITAMFDHLAPLIAAGAISAPIAATYRFDQARQAITKATQSGGKVLFTPET